MVRQKNRWLLVQLDFESDIISSCCSSGGGSLSKDTPNNYRNKKRKLQSSNSNMSELSINSGIQHSILQINSTDIYRSLQETITQNFGLVAQCTTEVQVRLYDPKVRLAIIKTTRDKCPIVRSSITLMTHIKQGGDVLKIVASVVSVSGSARAARNSAWLEIKKRFFNQDLETIGFKKKEQWEKKGRNAMGKSLKELEDRLEKIDSCC